MVNLCRDVVLVKVIIIVNLDLKVLVLQIILIIIIVIVNFTMLDEVNNLLVKVIKDEPKVHLVNQRHVVIKVHILLKINLSNYKILIDLFDANIVEKMVKD